MLADENIRKGLEAKVSAAEKQLSQLQVGQACGTPHYFYYNYIRRDFFFFFFLCFAMEPHLF